MRKTIVVLLGIMLIVAVVAAQEHQMGGDQKKLLSPRRNAEAAMGNGKKVYVDYGAPSMRGRKIMGGLVPFDNVWRTGANEATSFKTESDLMVNGTRVPAGSYTLYTIPSANGWKLIINKETGQWGTKYDQAQDLGRFDMQVKQLDKPMELMTMLLDPKQDGGVVLRVQWETTDASIELKPAK